MVKPEVKFILVSSVLLLLLVISTGKRWERRRAWGASPVSSPQKECSSCQTITVGGKPLLVEVMKTPDELERGLSGRKSIDERSGAGGMLFVMPDKRVPTFWMKDMYIPLDFIWIDDGEIIALHENVPPPSPGTYDTDLKIYSPNKKATHVLEVSAGFIKEHGVKIGTRVEITK
jgi:uncharacterized membrane protein (UPF0127 family)